MEDSDNPTVIQSPAFRFLQVDGRRFPERTVIAQATPTSGSLWLGCRSGRIPPGAVLGSVELYLFRVWADLREHPPCEDGTVIGWNSEQWGVTSPGARHWDPHLQCAQVDTCESS